MPEPEVYTPQDVLKLVEKELLKLGSHKNVEIMMQGYLVPKPDEKALMGAVVILIAELRHKIEKIREKLPEDPVEAANLIAKRAKRKPKTTLDEFIENNEIETTDVQVVDGITFAKVKKK